MKQLKKISDKIKKENTSLKKKFNRNPQKVKSKFLTDPNRLMTGWPINW